MNCLLSLLKCSSDELIAFEGVTDRQTGQSVDEDGYPSNPFVSLAVNEFAEPIKNVMPAVDALLSLMQSDPIVSRFVCNPVPKYLTHIETNQCKLLQFEFCRLQ